MRLETVDDALRMLADLGAPPRLVRHHALVAEAAHELIAGLPRFATCFDARLVVLGAALHDAGKIVHPDELHTPGSAHERAGERMLRAAGQEELARFCVTHASWDADDATLDDLLVAAADKLWKGKRVAELERCSIERLAAASRSKFWDVFVEVDDSFERIAARGPERLRRSEAGDQ